MDRGGTVPRALIAGPAQGNATYRDHREPGSRLLNNLHTQLQLIAEQKLGGPLGESRETAQGRRAESWRSARSLRNIRRNLEGLRALYRTGFAARLRDRGLDRQIEEAFDNALGALAAIPGPLAQAVEDPAARPGVQTLRAEVTALLGLIGGDPARALDLPLGFNSLDGD